MGELVSIQLRPRHGRDALLHVIEVAADPLRCQELGEASPQLGRPRLAHIDRAELAGPLVHVLEQVAVDRSDVLGVVGARHVRDPEAQLDGSPVGRTVLKIVQRGRVTLAVQVA